MGCFYTYFNAPNDDAAADVVDVGPSGTFSPVIDAVEATVQAGTLLALLTGRDYDQITSDDSWSRLVSSPDDESAWVVSMSSAFTDVLAVTTDERFAEIVGPWSETEEFWGSGDPETLLPMLKEWRDVAQAGRARDEAMYCWMAL